MIKVLNDLYDYDLKIYQDKDKFKFSLDSILLAEFVNIKLTTKKILDLCTGNAPIPLILSTKTKAEITGVEIQKDIFDLGNKSVLLNHKENQIKLINDDANNCKNYFPGNNFDVITCNPPYFKFEKTAIVNKTMEKAIARHEIKINLCDIINISNYLLKSKGSLYLSHRTERLEEIINILNKNNYSVKTLQFIYPSKNKPSEMVLIEAVKNGNSGLKVLNPIFIEEYSSYQGIFRK